MSRRLEILQGSLEKKQAIFDARIKSHFEDVARANGQPLNDKRCGAATFKRWEKQNDSIRNAQKEIEKTQEAIRREEEKIAYVNAFDVPDILKPLLAQGILIQWRKHPRFFFVNGVEKARLIVQENGTIAYKYLSQIPNQEQYAIFRDVVNNILKLQKEASND